MLVGEAGQQLLDRPPADSSETMQQLADSIRCTFAEKPARPEEVRMAIARGCRNAAMGGIALEGALLTLGRVQDGSLQQSVHVRREGPVDESAYELWPAATGLEPDDMHLLSTLYTETNADFSAAVAMTDEERPDITDLWRSHHDIANTSTTELLEAIAATPEDERTARDKYLFDWYSRGAPFTMSAHERAAATNQPTVKIAFNLLVTTQRHASNTLTGPQLAATFRDNLDRASGLAGGKHTVVTHKLTPACAPHEADAPLTVLDNGHYDLGPFKSTNHVRAPGDCPGYALYSPGIRSPRREAQSALIRWHRTRTNRGKVSSWNPIDSIRSAEVSLLVSAAIAETIWPDREPFQPASFGQ